MLFQLLLVATATPAMATPASAPSHPAASTHPGSVDCSRHQLLTHTPPAFPHTPHTEGTLESTLPLGHGE